MFHFHIIGTYYYIFQVSNRPGPGKRLRDEDEPEPVPESDTEPDAEPDNDGDAIVMKPIPKRVAPTHSSKTTITIGEMYSKWQEQTIKFNATQKHDNPIKIHKINENR